MVREKYPPDGYVPTRSVVEGIEIYMPAPQIDDYDKQVDFACPNCGGVQAYSVSDGGLSCTSCGYYQAPTGMRVGRSASKNEFRTATSEQKKQERIQNQTDISSAAAAVTSTSATSEASPTPKSAKVEPKIADDYDWGEERQELQCNNCGARILLDPKSLTHICPFCGSSSVIQHAFDHDKMRPRYLVPFKVEDQAAKDGIQTWLGSSWMTPSDLQQRAGLDVLTGIYLPYWTFTANCSADWKAQVGHTRTRGTGKNRQTYTEWRWESGSVSERFRDLLVAGTNKLNQRLLHEVSAFDMGSLVEYDTSYLAGFNAQTYDIGRDSAWTTGREMMREATRMACRRDASTSKIRNFSMTLDFKDETWRYILLPVYLSTYRYENETYSVMLNGQTGQITGQRPVDWRKVGSAIVTCFIPSLLIALSALFFFEGEQAQNVLVIGGVAAIIAVAISIWLASSALNIRKAN